MKRRNLVRRSGETEENWNRRRLMDGMKEEPQRGCWLWARAHDHDGYGTATYRGRTVKVHRLAYETFVGAIPAGANVMHSCDQPSCINPAHLKLGTRRDNMRDCAAKGRHFLQRNPSATPLPQHIGSDNALSKLTDAEVVAIRQLLSVGQSVSRVAGSFGVSDNCIRNIKRGKSWKHLPASTLEVAGQQPKEEE